MLIFQDKKQPPPPFCALIFIPERGTKGHTDEQNSFISSQKLDSTANPRTFDLDAIIFSI